MIVTEDKTINIEHRCPRDPFFISWLNSKGGREHWLFGQVQTHGIQTATGNTANKYSNDLSTQRGNLEELTKDAQNFIVGQSLARQSEINALKNMLYSLDVELLLNPKTWQSEGPKWVKVYPRTGSFTLFETQEPFPLIEITFDFSTINNQSK